MSNAAVFNTREDSQPCLRRISSSVYDPYLPSHHITNPNIATSHLIPQYTTHLPSHQDNILLLSSSHGPAQPQPHLEAQYSPVTESASTDSLRALASKDATDEIRAESELRTGEREAEAEGDG